jgi:DNA-directed RNA polymerase beta' subunit
MKIPKPKKEKKSKRQKLFDKAWGMFSLHIRTRDKGICFTCGADKGIKKTHAGHFTHGKSTPVYFDEHNVHCQCVDCNHFKSGNRGIYLRNIQKKYGIKEGDRLIQAQFETHYYSIKELEAIIEDLKIKLGCS